MLVTLSTGHTEGLREGGASPDAALLGGYHLGFGLGAQLATAALA